MDDQAPSAPKLRANEKSSARSRQRRISSIATLSLVVVVLVLIGMRSFVSDGGRSGPGLIYTIPLGASQTVPAGLKSAVNMPTDIVFAANENAKITVINNDTVTHLAGPFLVGPGKTYTQTFPTPGRYPITCTVNADESIVVTVQ
ncbi:hypothetical protein BH09CHL1_BH09CHL1_02340 [soil metagenome]